MPEMSLDLGNYIIDYSYLYRLFKFQGWSSYSFYLGSNTFYPGLPNPEPYVVTAKSAAYSTVIGSPTLLST